uniref:Uncharacterized protein n=1 Tax=Elaeophora elaphi TaxID=1147741 RepID=A0A0R3RPT1_9BILA
MVSLSFVPQTFSKAKRDDKKKLASVATISKKRNKEFTNSMTTALLIETQQQKPRTKLPNWDYCFPKDLLAVLGGNKDFYKNDCTCEPILLNSLEHRTGIPFLFLLFTSFQKHIIA